MYDTQDPSTPYQASPTFPNHGAPPSGKAGGPAPAAAPRATRPAGLQGSPGGLVRATLGAAAAAAVILGVFWLPSEYGIDPTGLGRTMGLTQMGEIKQQLYAEAAADDASAALASTPAAPGAPSGPVSVALDAELTQRLDGIEAQLAALTAALDATPQTVSVTTPQTAPSAAATSDAPDDELAILLTSQDAAVPLPPATEVATAPTWRDEVSYTLAPTEGIEIKLAMLEGATAEFEWTANGGVLNHDTHGDGSGQNVTYTRGRGVPGETGALTAAFTGNHGWFWRNRTDAPVTFTLRTRGDYEELKTPRG